jgi:hypothetical protein
VGHKVSAQRLSAQGQAAERGVGFQARVFQRAGAGDGKAQRAGCIRVLAAQAFDFGYVDAGPLASTWKRRDLRS